MRTFLLIALLVAVCALMAIGFVLPVAAQDATPTADLEVDCSGQPIPADTDTLTTCRFTATNTGHVPLSGLQVALTATQNLSIPDRYYFFGAARDGQELPISPNDLDHPLNDLAPGASSTVTLRTIVRSSHDYGAAAVLLRRPDDGSPDVIFDTEMVEGRTGAVPASPLRLMLDSDPPGGVGGEPPPRVGMLIIENAGDAEIDEISLDLNIGEEAQLVASSVEGGDEPWRLDSTGHQALGIDRLEPNQVRRWVLRFEPTQPTSNCGFVSAAAVATTDAGLVVAKISDTSIAFGRCDLSALPHGGFGPTPGREALGPLTTMMLVGGALCVSAGGALRRASLAARKRRAVA